jgi:flagellar hook-associated protein 1 FlgK
LIKRYEVRGEDANDYRDQRNLLLDELSKYVKFEAFEDKDGAINVHSEGNYLVSGDDSHELTTAKVGNATSMLKVIWADDGEDFIKFFGDISYSSENNTDIGSIRSIMVARGLKVANYLDLPVRPNIADYTDTTGVVDETAYKAAMTKFDQDTEIYNKQISPSSITKLQSELDLYMHEIATSINDILCPNKDVVDSNGNALKILDVENASIGDDFDKSVGIELFSRKGMSRYTLQEITLEGETEPIMAYVYNEEDSGNPDSLYSLAQLEVNPQLLRNPSMLPVKYNDQSGHREGYNSTIYENMLKAWDDAQLPMSPNDMTTYSFTDYYRAMVGEIGNQGHVWTASINQQTLVTAEAENNRQMVMGVSNEEELSDLVRFQHCYNASSRYITVVDDMLRHLIERL